MNATVRPDRSGNVTAQHGILNKSHVTRGRHAEFQQRYPLVWSEDTGGRWAAAPARVTPGRAADT